MNRVLDTRLAGILFVLPFGWILLNTHTAPGEVSTSPGIATQRPQSGTYVETSGDGRFLIPYRQVIPGTNVAFEMIPVPGGNFMLGSPKSEAGRSTDEGPQRRVTLDTFWIGKCEVTWAEYRNYMELCHVFEQFDDLGIRRVLAENRLDAITAPSKLYDPTFTFQSGEEPDLPAVSMSQYAAKQYTKWLSLLTGQFYRLPTEVEWEYACRAGTSTAYSFGNDAAELDDYAWHSGNSDFFTYPVGNKKPNAWGLYDMHGNACEWVLDGYEEDGYMKLGSESVGDKPLVVWPTKLYPRVLRGGSSLAEPGDCRSAARRASDEEYRAYDPNTPKSPWWFASDESQDIGFRIVRPYCEPASDERTKYWDADLPRIQRVADYRIDEEGRGERGVVDPELPAAIKRLNLATTPADSPIKPETTDGAFE